MTTTPPPGRRRVSRPPAAAPVSKPLRSARPDTVPVRRAVSRGPRLARYGIWTALAAGPLTLAVVLAVPRTTVAPAAPAPRTTDAARTPADPQGVAEMFVDLWLRADATAPESNGITAAVGALVPQVDLPKRPRSDSTGPVAAKAVAVRTAYGLEGGVDGRGRGDQRPGGHGCGRCAAGAVLRCVRHRWQGRRPVHGHWSAGVENAASHRACSGVWGLVALEDRS
ncbi:hypothetical protein ACFVYT_42145 [Streptomyces sp. NPDC058290]|uniref:hypothetical protein n=1 Tax=Streptomyces sp. NPDC058290 TaxID=3346426 RepID=UPI0036E099BE